MLGIIKRVISGENMEEGQQPQSSNNNNDNHHPPNSNGNTMPDSTFAIIENDDDNAMDLSDDHHHQHSNHEDDNHTIGSSISDVSAAKGNDSEDVHLLMVPSDHPMVVMDETSSPTHRPPPAPRTTAALVSSIPKPSHLDRSDSRNSNDSYSSIGRQSSQNSSRDWGWFEETEHGSGPFAASKQPPPQRAPLNKEEEAFLVQQLQQAAAASASNNNNNMVIDEDPSSKRKKGDKKKKGTSMLLPHLTLTASEDMLMMDEETQQVLLDPPTDFESEARVMAVTAPNYVLEESLSSQRLWKDTAGNRPPQPLEERAFFEKMWAQNFARSQVEYRMPVEVLTATTPISMSPFADGNFDTSKELSNYTINAADGGNPQQVGGVGGGAPKQDVAEAALVSRLNDPARGSHSSGSGISGPYFHPHNHEVVNRKIKGSNSDEDLTILIKGDNVFGTTVSKSFARPGVNGGPIAGVDTVNISIASYRVIESKKYGKYAQFLVIYREGSIRDTIGVWKRYSDFQRLSEKVTKAHEGCAAVIANMSPLAVTEEHDVEHLPNAITSWRLLKKRQRWYRCLDAGYLSLKVFLLERFLHDILFESSSPDLLREFVKGE